jgi:hypothetical protein
MTSSPYQSSCIARFGVYELASACVVLSAHIRKVLQVLHSHVTEPRY